MLLVVIDSWRDRSSSVRDSTGHSRYVPISEIVKCALGCGYENTRGICVEVHISEKRVLQKYEIGFVRKQLVCKQC